MQKADTAYAEARKAADAKRQQATDAKNLAGEPGDKEMKRAEDSLAAVIKALADATNAKPPLDKALADAKDAALPLQQSLQDAAEKAAKDAEAMAKSAAEAANQLDDEAKKTTAQAAAKRRAADSARGAVARAQQAEQNFQSQVATAPKKLGEAETRKTADDERWPTPGINCRRHHRLPGSRASRIGGRVLRETGSEAEKQSALANAAKRNAADTTKTVLIQAWRIEAASADPSRHNREDPGRRPGEKEGSRRCLRRRQESGCHRHDRLPRLQQAALSGGVRRQDGFRRREESSGSRCRHQTEGSGRGEDCLDESAAGRAASADPG